MHKNIDFLTESFYRLIGLINANIYWKDIEGRYLGCNQHFLNQFGFKSSTELIGKNDYEIFSSIVSRDEISQVITNDQFALEHGFFEGEEYVNVNGETRTYLTKKVASFSNEGNISGVMGTSLDITYQKKLAELEGKKILMEEQLKITQIIDSVKASIYWKDQKSEKYLGCNQYMLDMFGIQTREEVIGKSLYDLVSRQEAEKINEIDISVLSNGHYEGEENFTLPSGEERTYYTIKNQLTNSNGEIIGLVGTSIDITYQKELTELERKKFFMEEQLKITQIIDSVNASIYWKDHKCEKYLGCNQYMLDMLGLESREKIIGKTEYDFLSHDEAQKINEIDNFVLANGHYEGEESFTLPNGEEKIYYTIKNQLTNSSGQVVGLVGTSIDITAQKEAESLKLEMERERQQKEILQLERKAQQFLAEQQAKFNTIVDETVHDIRNPLSVINTTLSACHELPEEKLTRLRQSLNNALNILYNLESHRTKRSTSTSTGVESRQDLLIADYVDEIVDEKKYQYINQPIDFELDVTNAAKTAHVDCQPSQLRRALSNLINNAIDALPENRNGVIKIVVDANEKWVEITIRDNGIGMTSEAIQKIHQRISFTENKLHGHGLGLQQVGEMLDYNRGKMEIESTLGQGTTFHLFFPRSAPPNWLAQEIVLQTDTIVLVLEDDTSLHQTWEYVLGQFVRRYPTLQLKCFVQGEEVLRFVQALSDEERIRVLLLADYELTYQIQNGLQIIIASQINNAILITGHSSNAEVRKAAVERGINLLPKQFIDKVTIRLASDPDISAANQQQTFVDE